MHDLIVIGGGAAGIFAAVCAKRVNKNASVLLLEKSNTLLAKVRISGGGRCNVTHECFDPKQLAENYPRGRRELLGPFHRFQPSDTIDWFNMRGVNLKAEDDGRIFPTTDDSQTIIDCLLKEAKKLGVAIEKQVRISSIEKRENGFLLDTYETKKVVLATGSAQRGHTWAKELGHTIIAPLPSLFTFNVPTSTLKYLSGLAVNPACIKIEGHTQTGPVLITHFGFSGPAAIKLSAWAARELYAKKYRSTLTIDWLPEHTYDELFNDIERIKTLPKKLWKHFAPNLDHLSHKAKRALIENLKENTHNVDGKTTNKEEFVTCGGIKLSEVNFKTMESKVCPGLYFAGEILDIDGITGGFNFQNAWTTGYIAGTSAFQELVS